MRVICGADGCRAGWVAVTQDLDTGSVTWRLCSSAQELFDLRPSPQVLAVDIPIGLPERGARACDQEARRLLGRGRASSVFPAPIRPVLAACSYEAACQIRFQEEGKKLSHQAWGIVPKVREVDHLLRLDSKLQAVVREIHPEVCFTFLGGGRPMRHSKKTTAGREERRELLAPIFGPWLQAALAERRALSSLADDILDAFAALWTAERIASGIARSLPAVPPVDPFGLRMEILA